MNYALFGDSHAQAVFPLLRNNLEREGHQVVISKPVAGWTLKKHLENGFESHLSDVITIANSNVDALVLSLGGNNSNLSPSYGNTVQEALDIASRYGVKKVYWVSPATAIRPDVQLRHEWTTNYLKLNLPRKVQFIDIRSLTKSDHRSDGVHFNPQKYKEWAKEVSTAILRPRAITQIPNWTWWFAGSFIILNVGIFMWRKK